MKPIRIALIIANFICLGALHTQAEDSLFNIPTNANQELPPGVPRVIETNGKVLFIDSTFTTPAFQEKGLQLVINEANNVVSELQLLETEPITRSNLVGAYISPFGFAYKTQKLGNITTENYSYGIEQDYKFSDLTIADYDRRFLDYQNKHYLPVSQIDTNGAYQLATQWLSAVHMDVAGLNRDCNVRVALVSDWDGTKRPKGEFAPVYFISWAPKVKTKRPSGSSAYVELFLPTKTLLQLSVSSARYILRPPVTFTNLAALFPGKAIITTNQPVEMKIMGGLPTDNEGPYKNFPRQ